MRSYFELLTDITEDEIAALLAGHPKEAKVALAKSVIAAYHDAAAGDEAALRWQREIGEGARPSDIPVTDVKRSDLTEGKTTAATLLRMVKLVNSSSEARRAIQQGGAYYGEEKERFSAHDESVTVTDGMLLWVGKKRVCQVRLVD